MKKLNVAIAGFGVVGKKRYEILKKVRDVNIIAISAVVYLLTLPISFFHYQKLKKQNQDKDSIEDDDDLEDVL